MKIALFLYFIASTDGYPVSSQLVFGVSRAFVAICIREVADAILKN